MQTVNAKTIRIATFNVSMDATNYVERGQKIVGNELFERLKTKEHPQIQNVAEIIQRVRPEIVLLNEFDYTTDEQKGVMAFLNHYLNKPQGKNLAIDYPYFYTAPVNTGIDSGHDLTNDGVASGTLADAFGFGYYPGQYGMLILSRFPIKSEDVRTFQYFKWKDMPDNLMVQTRKEDASPWYSEAAQQVLRLSSKSHWDVPIEIDGQIIHILASHPTPPVFDGAEDRNGKRNHDEIRFWNNYLSGTKQAAYIYDDQGVSGGFKGQRFVVLGDLNASTTEGDAHKQAIENLLTHEKVNGLYIPSSQGAKNHSPDNKLGKYHTAAWRMRADYVLPSKAGMKIIDGGVFWPQEDEPLFRLIKERNSSSDHRLVWLDIKLK